MGTWAWYEAAARFGKDRLERLVIRLGRRVALTRRDIRVADAWFDRHGAKAVLLGRRVPTVRTLISVPAGLCGMRRGPFLAYTTIGTTVWTSLPTLAG